MIITHHGGEFFKVSFGDTTLAFNPISKNSKLKQTRFGADIAFITSEHPDFTGVDQVSHGEKEPFVIRGPGEYEVREIVIKGYQTTSEYGGKEVINTAYLVTFEKMFLLFLGALSTKELPKGLQEALDKIDILFVPIGGDGVLIPQKAYELAVSIEPKMIVPMHHTDIGIPNALQLFLKEEGSASDNHKPISKLTLKNKDLEDKQNEIVVFSS
ncbi:TPA: hypothetical protein DEP58_05515 [Patescibacteria group bacterium]|nr:MAG: Zn-dependent hydrolase of the metallo-beta-lactamase superfamily [Parcubacteria group bacterium GW2011_GWD2_42_14]HCC05724.1 hypothetical protein [Patescibacteria group bacterium]